MGSKQSITIWTQSIYMHVMLIGDTKLTLGVSVSMHGCVSRLSLCGPVMDWRPVQGAPRLSPDDSWDRLQL